jgi:hypothetical protein
VALWAARTAVLDVVGRAGAARRVHDRVAVARRSVCPRARARVGRLGRVWGRYRVYRRYRAGQGW